MSTTAFFKLTNADWLEFFGQLTKSELGILFHLKTLNPFGDRSIEIDTASLAEILSLSRRAIQRGLKRLKDLNIIQTSKAIVKCTFTRSTPSTKNTSPGQNCRTDDKNVATVPKVSHIRQECRDRAVKPSEDKPSSSSQINKKFSDFLHSLQEAEREKFFEFIRQQTKDFDPPIACVTDYLRSQSRYLELYANFRRVVPESKVNFSIKDWQRSPDWEGIKAEIHRGGPAFVAIGGIDRTYEHIPHKVRKQLWEFVKANF